LASIFERLPLDHHSLDRENSFTRRVFSGVSFADEYRLAPTLRPQAGDLGA
jgi:hypothetical protein